MTSRFLFKSLLCFAVSGAGFTNQIHQANAIGTHQQYCYNFSLPLDGALYSPDKSDRINVREQPNKRSKIIYIGSSKTPVTIHKQVLGDSNLCWYRVKIYNSKITGWVRGDLLDYYLD